MNSTRKKSPRLPKNETTGFTLVEVLIALLIFSIAVVGVITVAAQGDLNVNNAKNKVVANYLADEGIELVRSMRDSYYVDGITAAGPGLESVGATTGWSNFTSTTSSLCSTACNIDSTNTAGSALFPSAANVADCGVFSGMACPLYSTPSGGYTYYPGIAGTQSLFSRRIVVTPLSPDEVRVDSIVQWNEGTTIQKIVQSENVYNWFN